MEIDSPHPQEIYSFGKSFFASIIPIACASQILENLALIDGDDLFRLAHERFIQSSLLLNDVMRRLTKFLQFRRKRHHDQGRTKEITAVVLNIDDRSNAALNVARSMGI